VNTVIIKKQEIKKHAFLKSYFFLLITLFPIFLLQSIYKNQWLIIRSRLKLTK